MTSRLYYTDAYLTTFEARILELSDDRRRVYLDQSAFYPASGGQPFDLGALAGASIAEIVDEDDRVAHVLADPLPRAAGEIVRGTIDWPRRFDHMQQHTGQHLLSAVFADIFGFETASVHFGADRSTLDLDVGAIDAKQLVDAERRANEIVFENRPVSVGFEDAGTATGLRKAPTREGTIRIVTIESLDRSACGGTHVRATGEIGAIVLRTTERMRKQTRIEFLCGARVVRQARSDFETLSGIALSMKASVAEAPALVAAQGEQLRDALSVRKRLEGELAVFQARELYDGTTPNAKGVHVTFNRRDKGSVDDIRALALAFASQPKAVFVATVASPATILVASSDDSGIDAGGLLKPALAAAGGRGGGSPRLAQGSVPSESALAAVVGALEDSIA
jgi:alanyl-tRNA synthetase